LSFPTILLMSAFSRFPFALPTTNLSRFICLLISLSVLCFCAFPLCFLRLWLFSLSPFFPVWWLRSIRVIRPSSANLTYFAMLVFNSALASSSSTRQGQYFRRRILESRAARLPNFKEPICHFSWVWSRLYVILSIMNLILTDE
jgi:hypothetical protein